MDDYADRLMEFPSGVLGVALGTFCCRRCRKVLPVAIMMNTTVDGLGAASLFPVGAAECGCVGILSGPLTVSLFQYGKFTAFMR